jgi:hypothetical protein
MRPIPLRPDPLALATRNVAGLARAIIAKATAKIERCSDASAILRTRWPDDPIASLVLRAASHPAMLATDIALGRSVVADLISTIGPVGAGARLLQATWMDEQTSMMKPLQTWALIGPVRSYPAWATSAQNNRATTSLILTMLLIAQTSSPLATR